MKPPFTNELEESLSSFVANSSDDDLRLAFGEADYEFYKHFDFPIPGVSQDRFLDNVKVATGMVSLASAKFSGDVLDEETYFVTMSNCLLAPQEDHSENEAPHALLMVA